MPFFEEVNLYNTLSGASGRFSSNFSVIQTTSSASFDTALPQLVCPSSTLTNPQSAGTAGVRALTNYKACAAASVVANGVPASTDTTGGGVLTKDCWQQSMTANNSYGGIDLRQVGDGTSKSTMIGEVCDAGDTSGWGSGATAWITATAAIGPTYTSGQNPAITKVTGRGTTSTFYGAGNTQGLGSFHTGGLMLHGYADGPTSAISTDVDSGVLGAIYTRNNGENVAELP
jgi:hypothetical protein